MNLRQSKSHGSEMVGMRKVILEAYEIGFLTKLFGGFLVLFLVMIFLILLELVRGKASKEALAGIGIYMVFAVIVTGLMVFSLRNLRKGPRMAVALAESTTVVGNRLIFQGELEFEYGRVTLTQAPENRRLKREFKSLERGKSSTFEFPEEGFKVVATMERGFARFPALRILSRPYERIVLVFLTDSGRVEGKKVLTLPTSGGYIDLEVEGRGRKLRGRFYVPPGENRTAEAALSAPETPGLSVKIADSSMGEFTYPLLPEEKLVVFAPYGSLTLENLLGTLKIKETAMGHGEFTLILSTRGLRRGEVREYSFTVVPEKEGVEQN